MIIDKAIRISEEQIFRSFIGRGFFTCSNVHVKLGNLLGYSGLCEVFKRCLKQNNQEKRRNTDCPSWDAIDKDDIPRDC